MRRAARYLGIAWIVAVVLAGVALIGMGLLKGSRGPIYLLFGAALPGILAYRWGSRRALPDAPHPRTAPIVPAKGDSHVLEMDSDPLKPIALRLESNTRQDPQSTAD